MQLESPYRTPASVTSASPQPERLTPAEAFEQSLNAAEFHFDLCTHRLEIERRLAWRSYYLSLVLFGGMAGAFLTWAIRTLFP